MTPARAVNGGTAGLALQPLEGGFDDPFGL